MDEDFWYEQEKIYYIRYMKWRKKNDNASNQ
jgi:hypothetical protein